MDLSRRSIIGVAALAGGLVSARPPAGAAELTGADRDLIVRMFGRVAGASARIVLAMPERFANGFSVPMSLSVDSPMTDGDHVSAVTVIAPAKPIVLVARFAFTPRSGLAVVTTRIRLAKPQSVIAVAEMADASLLMASRWVSVESDGCS